MCGINGIISISAQATDHRSTVEKMNKVLAHRGPDNSGIYENKKVALGQTRLSIIDLSQQAHQPMEDVHGNLSVVFNGEIYNYQSLKEELSDYPFRTNSDTEVIIAAYQKWGAQFLNQLQGMFALAIYDQQKEQTLLARDRYGIKPLYYTRQDQELIFSSEIKALKASGKIQQKISQDALCDYLRTQTVQTPETIFEEVHMLNPGSSLIISEDGLKTQLYYQINQKENFQQDSFSSARAKVYDLVHESVQDRLVADVPTGCFLSGGIDSSILTAAAAQGSKQQLSTFSVDFKEQEFSERPFIDEMVERYDTNHHYLELQADDFLSSIPDALDAMDHPSGDGPNTYAISEATKKQGIKVALSGLGGDELFSGYPIFHQLPNLLRNKALQSSPLLMRQLAGHLLTLKNSKSIKQKKKRAVLGTNPFHLNTIYPLSRQIFLDDQVKRLLNMNKLPKNAITEWLDQAAISDQSDNFPLQTQISIAEMNSYMQNTLLRDADQMSMAHALEIRVPFLDHRLVSYVHQLPDKYKLGHYNKNLLVEAFREDLPPNIYRRKKMGFVLPYEHWMRHELKDFCKENLNALERHNSFNMNEIKKLWQLFLNNSPVISWSRIWGLVVLGYKLEQWSYESTP